MSNLPDNLTPVRPAHVFDEARLADYMKANVEGYRGPISILQFEGGQSNPTFHLTDGGGRMYVLRKKPPGKLLPSAHQVDREYRVIKALSDHSDVPVPKPYALCQDDAVIGTAFYIMEFLPGRILADPKMPGISPADRGKIFDSMNDVLARIHNVDYRAAGLGDFGREGQYIQRQIARWSSQYDLSRTANIESMELLKTWLPAHIPRGDETRIKRALIGPIEGPPLRFGLRDVEAEIRAWRERGVVPRRAKWFATLAMTASAAVLQFTSVPLWLKMGAPAFMAGVAVWLWTRPED